MGAQRLQPPVWATTARVPQHVVHRAFVNETVVLNLTSGRYHGLNPVAGRMLAVLDASATVADAIEQLVAEYDQPRERIEADLRALCAELAERGLIELDAAG